MPAIDAAGLDRKALAARGADAVLKMILVDGFFHADPHPGNVMYLPGNRIALIDFGMVGRLSPVRRSQVVDLLAGLARQDEEAMLEVFLEWRGADDVDEARLAADLGELAFDYADVPLKDVKLGVLLQRISAILREHAIVMPADLTLLFKALISLEGLGRQYDPEFRLIERVKPFLDRAMRRALPAGRSGAARASDARTTSSASSPQCRATSRAWSRTRVKAAFGSISTSSASTASATGSTALSIA